MRMAEMFEISKENCENKISLQIYDFQKGYVIL